MRKIITTLLLIFLLSSVFTQTVTEIHRESFTNRNNLSSVPAGKLGANGRWASCFSSEIDRFDTNSVFTCWTGWNGDGIGANAQNFMIQDQDAITGGLLNVSLIVDMGTVASENTGEIKFYGLFGGQSPSASYTSIDSVKLYISVDNGLTYNRKFVISMRNTDTLKMTDGSVSTDLLYGVYTKRYVSLGDSLNGKTIKIKLDVINFNKSGKALVFDEFSLTHTSASTPLPIQLLSFRGNCENSLISLYWTTASELNNNYFGIERGEDGINYTKIGEVSGSGNSTSIVNYQFRYIDTSNVELSYYRLSQVDYDDKETYFNPISISCSDKNISRYIIPNPVREGENWVISGSLPTDSIRIYDMTGRSVVNLLRGVYIIKVNNIFISKLIVN